MHSVFFSKFPFGTSVAKEIEQYEMQQILFLRGRMLFNVQQHYIPDNKVWKLIGLVSFFIEIKYSMAYISV